MSLGEKSQRDLVLYSPNNCQQHAHKLRTVKDALTKPSKTVGELKRQYGRSWTVSYLMAWLVDLNDFANVKQPMSDAQIEFTANEMLNYSLKITDLTLFFKQIKSGKYGQYYENLGSDKILGWLEDYFNERCEVATTIKNTPVKLTDVHPDVSKAMFRGVGQEKLEHGTYGTKNGLGTRTKKALKIDLIKKIQETPTDELREYLIKNDKKSKNFNQEIYELIETEIDKRK